jgi:membrane protease YdiL (CAAX protease family)
MPGLVLTLGFPVVLAVGFALLRALSPRAAGRHGLAFYLLLLLIPLGVVLSTDGDTVAGSLAWPHLFGWPAVIAVLTSIALALLVAMLLFFAELYLTRLLPLRALRQRTPREHGIQAIAPRNCLQGLLLTLGIVVAEEALWRAYLIGYLAGPCALPQGVAVLIAALSFGSIHFYFGARTVAFKSISGFAWGGLCLLTASLWAPVVSHLLYNCLAWRRLRRDSPHATGGD